MTSLAEPTISEKGLRSATSQYDVFAGFLPRLLLELLAQRRTATGKSPRREAATATARRAAHELEMSAGVTRILTDYQLADYQRRLRALITELETLSQEIADADPRWQR